MRRQQPVTLRLITDQDATVEQHCSLCLFLCSSEPEECKHNPYRQEIERLGSRIPSPSSYAGTSDSNADNVSNSIIRAKILTTSPPAKNKPRLRHKLSPTETTLRELNSKQSRQSVVREKQSEERLQQAYEFQIMKYLETPLAEKRPLKGNFSLSSH